MNIDNKIFFKGLLTIVCIIAIVSILTAMRKNNSMSLSEYASSTPGVSASDSDSVSDNDIADEGDSESQVTDLEENLQNISADNTIAPETPPIGVSLNGESMAEYRIIHEDSFCYEPLSDNLRRYITGVSFPQTDGESTDSSGTPALAITYDDLVYVHLLHYDFDGNIAEGELICNKAIAQDLVEIFYELYQNEYRLERVKLIDEYDGDDTASMLDNNTSCFNYRNVDNSSNLSKHAYGLAVDVNPFYNPYITYEANGAERVSPEGAEPYSDRNASFPYKIDENDLCYKLFKQHGFIWGGNWNSCKDYQHFQKTIH